MDTQQRSSQPKAAFYVTVGCLLGLLLVNLAQPMVNTPVEAAGNNTVPGVGYDSEFVRNVVLSYSYETSPNSTVGDDSLAVDSIVFLPNYVLVKSSKGTTSLFAVNKLRRFSYRPADSE